MDERFHFNSVVYMFFIPMKGNKNVRVYKMKQKLSTDRGSRKRNKTTILPNNH